MGTNTMRRIRILGILTYLLLIPTVLYGQLKELELTKIENPDRAIPVFVDLPNAAAIIVTSSITNLSFDSNVEVVADRSNPESGEYRILVNPFRQTITVNAPGFIQLRFNITVSESREVVYYEIQPKKPANSSLTAAGRGDFVLNTNPQGASISIEGLPDFNGTTPYTFQGYAAQQYDIELSLPNYETANYTMKIESQELLNDEIVLEPTFSFISVKSVDKYGAPITHFNVSYNSSTELINPPIKEGFTTVGKGDVEVNINANGYRDTTFNLELNAGEQLEETIVLNSNHSFVTFNVVNTYGQKISDSEIIVPEEAIVNEIQTKNFDYTLLEGEYYIQFYAEGFAERTIKFSSIAGLEINQEVILVTPEEFSLLPAPVRIFTDKGAKITIQNSYSENEVLEEVFVPGTYNVKITHPYLNKTDKIFVQPEVPQNFYIPVLPQKKTALARGLIPGGGHLYTKQKRGWVYLGLTLGLAGTGLHQYLEYQNAEDQFSLAVNAYQSATDDTQFNTLRQNIITAQRDRDQLFDQSMYLLSSSLITYVISYIDISIIKPRFGYR